MRVYRGSAAGLWFGVVFAVLALAFPGVVVFQLVTGVRLIVGRSYNPGGVHSMTGLEMFEFGLLGSCLVGFGLLAVVDWYNAVFQTTDTGIRKLTTFRRVSFRADWGDLKSASKRKGQNGQVVYVIATADRELVIPDCQSLVELRRQIMESAAHVNFSQWRH